MVVVKNRIAHLRKARGLTQQALAKLAGTSQQQVQRIEAGVQGAQLELALKISAALGAELPDVFPSLDPKPKKGLRDSRYFIDSAKLREAGLDPDPKSWTVKFFAFDGRVFEYVVPSDEKDRLEKIFSRTGEGIVVFSARTHWVAINQNRIAATQFLFDLGVSFEDEKEEKLELRLHLISAEQPIVFGIEPDTLLLEEDDDGSASQMQNLFSQLETGFVNEMVDFYDEDRERVYLMPTQMLVVEVPVVCCEPALWNAEVEESLEGQRGSAQSRDDRK
ncbi:helix-turn-helix transcriptional regulator [Bradyrhizobium sp. AZCC 2230]|uniref:helix-turn-helix transcriptional regulator n=1 Tax=Bradyrhizobium sp. AZCC 2230 TaxID=3117021 RepID=UPI002FF427EB